MEILDQTEAKPVIVKDKFGRIMRIFEWLFLAMAILGIGLKVMVLPFGSTLVLFGLMGLGGMYFPIGLVYAFLSKQFTHSKDRILVAVCSFMLGTGCIGILFSIQIWPMSRTNVNAAAFFFVPLLIVALLALNDKISVSKIAAKWTLVRLAIIAIPLWFFVFTSETEFYGMVGVLKDDTEFMELYRQCKEEGNREACQMVSERHEQYQDAQMQEFIERRTNR
jgi:hypothetical protein